MNEQQPNAAQAVVSEEDPTTQGAPQGAQDGQEGAQQEGQQADKSGEAKEEAKEEKDPRDKMLAKERRRIANLTRRNAEMAARLQMLAEQGLQKQPIDDTNRPADTDSESLTLRRSELDELIRKAAEKLAPDLSREKEQGERLRKAAASVRAELGDESFAEMTDDLAGIFDKTKQLAVLRTDKPADVIRYLTDPDNADEADRIAAMDDFDAGRALARLEAKLSAKPTKPQPSKAPAPIEAERGSGSTAGMPDPANTKAYIKWANEQERRSRH